MPQFQEQNMYKTISNALGNFKTAAKMDLRYNWRDLSWAERCAAARALVFMDEVAKHPAHYFSRARTFLAWHNRAVEYIRQNSLPNNAVTRAYEKVPAPADLVWDKVDPAMIYNSTLSDAYYQLCVTIMDWEYNRTSQKLASRARVNRDALDIKYYNENKENLIHVLNNTLTANLRRWLRQR